LFITTALSDFLSGQHRCLYYNISNCTGVHSNITKTSRFVERPFIHWIWWYSQPLSVTSCYCSNI